MTDVISTTQAAMLNDVERLRAISQNLANVSTVGYKREITMTRPFADLIISPGTGVSPQRIPGGLPVIQSTIDTSDGSMRHTGNPLDLALEMSAFFVVRGEQGEVYTRQGNFRLDEQGRLVTSRGAVVLGESGDIRLTTTQPRIDQAGGVWDGNTQVATLRMVRIPNPESLQRTGDGYYHPTADTNIEAAENARVRQGHLETANVIPMQEMIRMIETVRHFEAGQRLMRGYDNMLDRAINSLGEV